MQSEVGCIRMDGEVTRQLDKENGNLRLFDENFNEIAFLPRRSRQAENISPPAAGGMTQTVNVVLFLPLPDRQYRLYYGPCNLDPPAYRVGRLLGDVSPGAADLWTLGSEMTNATYRSDYAPPGQQNRKFRSWALSVFIVMVVLLIIRTRRQTRKLGQDT